MVDRKTRRVSAVLALSVVMLSFFASGSAGAAEPYGWKYVVAPGDTLWKIGVRFGVPLQAMINANPQLSNPNVLQVGMQIYVPYKPGAFIDGMFPLKKGTYEPYTDNYGDGRTWSPDGSGPVRTHDGVDIFAPKWTPVYSAWSGTVIRKGWNEYGGWRLTVQADDSTVFYYAHLAGYASGLSVGSTVRKGQLIGYVGDTGYGPVGTSGLFRPHLHFGIYKTPEWKAIDPYPYLRWWELLQT